MWLEASHGTMKPYGPLHRSLVGAVDTIAATAAWIDREAEAAGLHADARYGLQVCAEELLANILRHGRRPAPLIDVSLEFRAGLARLTVEDDGPPFDVAAATPHKVDTPLDQIQEGGLGINLIRTFAAAVTYGRVDGRNRVVVDVAEPSTPARMS